MGTRSDAGDRIVSICPIVANINPGGWIMDYNGLQKLEPESRRRAVVNLKRLRESLDQIMPKRTAEGTLVLGTWNIRNFDDNRFGHGHRLPESFFYLSEVLSRFDAIAVQEINEDLAPFRKLMSLLGREYQFLLTDITRGPSGNQERLGFIFHRDKVSFQGVAGEIVLPDSMLISDVTKKRQFARTPFACSFQSGWLQFMFATVHVYYGKASTSSDEYKRRVSEISTVAKVLAKRSVAEKCPYILVGDFNIDEVGDQAWDALENAQFTVYKNREGSNRNQTRFYDQISFKAPDNQMRLAQSGREQGVLPLFDILFREEDFDSYDAAMKEILASRIADAKEDLAYWQGRNASKTRTGKLKSIPKNIDQLKELRRTKSNRREYYLNEWRTFQLSDHCPLWVELDVDFAADYLESLKSQT